MRSSSPRGPVSRSEASWNAGLDGHDEQVDQLWHVVVDPGDPDVGPVLHDKPGAHPADDDRDEEADDRECCLHVGGDREPEP
jgi:hypothetical protein